MQQLSVHTRLAINVMLIMLTWGSFIYPSVFWIPPPHHPSSLSLAGCHPHRRLASSSGTHPWKQCNHWSHMVLEVAASSKKAPRCHPLGKPSFRLLVAFPEIGDAWGRHRQRWGNSVLYIFNKTIYYQQKKYKKLGYQHGWLIRENQTFKKRNHQSNIYQIVYSVSCCQILKQSLHPIQLQA